MISLEGKEAQMYERILAIGDIHGQWDRFKSLYGQIDFQPGRDLLIFLGDYIDRGRKSLYVLDWMYEHRNEKNIVMLRGNHEQMMINYYESGGTRDVWLWNGGDATRRALLKQNSEVQEQCLAFAKSLPLYFQISAGEKNFFFCHAGINPDKSLDEQDEDSLLWIREEYYDFYKGQDIIVSGHTPVSYVISDATKPIYRKNMILVDTGSYFIEGHISCIDVLSGKIWQSKDGSGEG